MSDQPPDRASSDPSKQAAWDSMSEAELDAALSHAASLAAELSGQFQSSDDPEASPRPASEGGPLDNASSGLDAELEQLQQLVGTARAEMQSAENAAPVASTTPAHAVPDFMSEFTAPNNPADHSEREATRSTVHGELVTAPVTRPPDRSMPTVVSEKPGVVGTGKMGVVGGAVKIPSLAVPRPEEPIAHAECERESRPGLVIRLVAPLFAILHGFASVLELIDRPLARLNSRVRRLAGWIAIALIVTSLMVFVRSIG